MFVIFRFDRDHKEDPHGGDDDDDDDGDGDDYVMTKIG
jgi:hypothetical protein